MSYKCALVAGASSGIGKTCSGTTEEAMHVKMAKPLDTSAWF